MNTLKKAKIGLISFISFVFILFILFFSADKFDQITTQSEAETLSISVMRLSVHCYAVEGFYPPDLTYLVEHYGLTYQSEKYFIDYQCFAKNIPPEITIVKKGGY